MEQTCSRCHEAMQEGFRYCPVCGLPQLVYSADPTDEKMQSDRWNEAMRDANVVDWKAAARPILPLAIAAGVLCSLASPGSFVGLLLMGAAAAWAVALYARAQQQAHRLTWLTARAGARIGLVCGLLAGATAFALSGCELYARRYILHQGSQIDNDWKQFVDIDMQFSQRIAGWAGDAAQIQAQQAQQQHLMLSPEGHAGFVVASFAFASFLQVLFAIAGGALGARRAARRPKNS